MTLQLLRTSTLFRLLVLAAVVALVVLGMLLLTQHPLTHVAIVSTSAQAGICLPGTILCP